jgi:hypothetical protein
MSKIYLYTTFYNEKNINRRSELEEAIRINSNLSAISKIIVFNEGDSIAHLAPGKIEEVLKHIN